MQHDPDSKNPTAIIDPTNSDNEISTPITPANPRQPSRQKATAQLLKLLPSAIRALGKGLKSRNEGIRFNSASKIVSKFVPDVTATESTVEDRKVIYQWLLYGERDPILERMQGAHKYGVQVLQGDAPQLLNSGDDMGNHTADKPIANRGPKTQDTVTGDNFLAGTETEKHPPLASVPSTPISGTN